MWDSSREEEHLRVELCASEQKFVKTQIKGSKAREPPVQTLSILFFFGSQFFQHRKIFKRSDVAGDRTAGRDLAQQPPHDLARTGFR